MIYHTRYHTLKSLSSIFYRHLIIFLELVESYGLIGYKQTSKACGGNADDLLEAFGEMILIYKAQL